MDLSRRRCLQGAIAVALSGAAPLRWVATAGAAPAKAAPPNQATRTSWYSRASYLPLVGSTFSVATGSSRSSLTLSSIADLNAQTGTGSAGDADARFSLLFTSESALAQGAWPVHHDVLGDATLFIVPVGRRVAPLNYEVVVNRLT